METLIDLNRWLHVTFGFTGLAAFWIPILTRKGGRVHRSAGKVFRFCAYVVLIGALLSVTLHLSEGLSQGDTPRTAPAEFAFLVFLGYLAFATLAGMRHGFQVLAHKHRLADLDTPLNRAVAWLAIAASAGLIAYALYYRPPMLIVMLALSPVGFGTGFGILKAIRGQRTERKAWMYEHMSAMIGTGIAFHTAFAVFGSGRLFDLGLEGWIAVVPWVLPAMIGIPATILWTRRYQRRFGDLPA